MRSEAIDVSTLAPMTSSDSTPRPHLDASLQGLLAQGDALHVCEVLPPELRFDLVYLDPPYGLGTTMTARVDRGQSRGRRSATSGPAAYVDPPGPEELVALIQSAQSLEQANAALHQGDHLGRLP